MENGANVPESLRETEAIILPLFHQVFINRSKIMQTVPAHIPTKNDFDSGRYGIHTALKKEDNGYSILLLLLPDELRGDLTEICMAYMQSEICIEAEDEISFARYIQSLNEKKAEKSQGSTGSAWFILRKYADIFAINPTREAAKQIEVYENTNTHTYLLKVPVKLKWVFEDIYDGAGGQIPVEYLAYLASAEDIFFGSKENVEKVRE